MSAFPLFRIAQFVLGMLLAKLYRERPSDEKYATLLVSGSIILGLIAFTNAGKLPEALVETVALAVFAALIYGLAYGKGKVAAILSHRVTVLLGNASYAVYIFQGPVASYLGMTNTGSWLMVTGYVTVLTAAAIGSMFWIEQPLRRLTLRRWGTGSSPAQCVTAMAHT